MDQQETSYLEQLRAREAEIEEFYAIGKTLSAEKNGRRLLEAVMDASIKLTSAEGGTIYLVVNRGDERCIPFTPQAAESTLLKFVIAKNRSHKVNLEAKTFAISRTSVSGYTAMTGRPLRIDDAYQIPDSVEYGFNSDYDRQTGYRTISILSVPMLNHRDQVLGVIQMVNKNVDGAVVPFTPKDESILHSLAGQAAVALENSLLYREMQALLDQLKAQNQQLNELSQRILRAHEDERTRIARDIHDGPAQLIANLSLKADITKKFMELHRLDEALQELEEFRAIAVRTSGDVRKILYDLKPSALEAGVVRAIGENCELLGKQTGAEVLFEHEGDDAGLEDYLQSTLYRVAQEACTNIRKYAQAKKVEVALRIGEETIDLVVEDDGRGFDPQATKREGPAGHAHGLGLGGMRERVALVKGTLTVNSAPGKGTRVTAVIPRK